jgi:hypothetical protein
MCSKWLEPQQAHPKPGIVAWRQAVRCGQVDVLEWAFTKRWLCQEDHCTKGLLDKAASAGRINVLGLDSDDSPDCNSGCRHLADTWINTCVFGQLASMAWIHDRFPASTPPRS